MHLRRRASEVGPDRKTEGKSVAKGRKLEVGLNARRDEAGMSR
jgi:hypothetical protein